jgi:cytochrome c biogenesis protein CcmG/thiol:disulfide interchange protein DsbE
MRIKSIADRTPESIRSVAVAAALLGSLALVACGGASSSGGGSAKSTEGAAHPLLGAAGPDFTQKTVKDGKAVSFHALRGKVTIVDFWATWCGPCKQSFPKLQDLSAKYKASGLEIVGISEDDEPQGIPTFADSLGAKFSLAWDEGKSIASKWKPKSMPTTFVVDKQGVVRFVHFGYHDGEELEIEKEIKGLL